MIIAKSSSLSTFIEIYSSIFISIISTRSFSSSSQPLPLSTLWAIYFKGIEPTTQISFLQQNRYFLFFFPINRHISSLSPKIAEIFRWLLKIILCIDAQSFQQIYQPPLLPMRFDPELNGNDLDQLTPTASTLPWLCAYSPSRRPDYCLNFYKCTEPYLFEIHPVGSA